MDKVNIEKFEQLGIADYYLDLSKFIHNFINRNYPLTAEDIQALTKNTDTLNIINRQKLTKVMNDELFNILTVQAINNQKYLKDLESGKNVKPINIGEYKQEIFNYQQQILEKLYEYTSCNENNKKNTLR